MGAFVRAYDSCLRTADLSRAEAAARANLHPSMVSRLLNGDTTITTQHLESLLRALPDDSDRAHCLRAWLLDQLPEEYRTSAVIHFGKAEEPKRRAPDALGEALDTLEAAAERRDELRRLLIYLAHLEAPDKSERASGGGPADTLSRSA